MFESLPVITRIIPPCIFYPAMVISPPSPSIYASPKRKRDSSDSVRSSPTFSPDLSRARANLPDYPFPDSSDKGDCGKARSPQSAVVSQFKDLELREPVVRQLAFFNDGGRARKRFAQMASFEEFEDAIPSQASGDGNTGGPHAELTSQSTSLDPGYDTCPQDRSNLAGSADRQDGAHAPVEGLSSIRERPRARKGSPTLDGDPEENPLTWHDSEITGHNPTDPNDDGYGINGIGFKPTAAIAWARSQRRKQQVADYKNREGREARQRRSERRRAGGVECRDDDPGSAALQSTKKAIRVRFEDG